AHGQVAPPSTARSVAPAAPALPAPSDPHSPRAAALSRSVGQVAAAAGIAAAPGTSPRASYRLSSRSSVPPVVVQFSSAEASQVQDMSEDLDVMTHIIDRALSEDEA